MPPVFIATLHSALPENRLPWVAPTQETATPARAQALQQLASDVPRARGAERWPELPPVSPPQERPPPPPPLLRSPSHPARGALPFALPTPAADAIPGGAGLLPISGRKLLHNVPDQQPLSTRWIAMVPPGLVPALGALPSLWGGVQQMGAAIAWQRMLLTKQQLCQHDSLLLAANICDSASGAAHAPMRALLDDSHMRLVREQAALGHALNETCFRLASLATELCGVITTALPQLHSLLGVGLGSAAMHALRAAFPYGLLAHGALGMGHSAMGLRALQQQEPWAKSAEAIAQSSAVRPLHWLQHSQRLHRDACKFHGVQLALWAGFTVALSVLLLAPTLPATAALGLGGVLGLSILGLAWQHFYMAERYDAPRALWLRPPWDHLAFAGPQRLESGFDLLLQHEQRLQRALRHLSKELTPLRRFMLHGLFDMTSIKPMQALFACCARKWLEPREADVWQAVRTSQAQHSEALEVLWTTQYWHKRAQLWRACADARQNLLAHTQQEARGLDLIELELTDFATEAHRHKNIVRRLTGGEEMDADVRCAIAVSQGFGHGAAKHMGPAMLIGQKAHNDELRRALAWAGRWRPIVSAADDGPSRRR